MMPHTRIAVVVVAIVIFTTATTAQRGASSIRSVSIPENNEEILPPFVAKPFDQTYFSWSITQLDDYPTGSGQSGDFLIGTFNFTQDLYVAIGINSPKKMRGPIILCKARGGRNTSGVGFCVDYEGPEDPDYAINLAAAQRTIVVSSQIIDNKYSLVFAKLIRPRATNVSIIEWDGSSRVIFAMGKWIDGAPEPKQHDAEDMSALLIDFNAGSVEKFKSTLHRTVIYVGIGCLGAVVIVSKIVRSMQLKISHMQRRIISVILCIGFVVLTVMYMFANYRDYKITVTRKATQRSLGDGAAWTLSCLLFPVGRRILFSDLLTVSHERAIKYHMGLALLTLVLVAAHGIAMWIVYGTEWVTRWRDKDEVSKLPGIFAFVLMILIIVFALLRNRVISFNVFRLTHYIYIPLLFFACCHYPKLAIGVAPGGALLLLSFLYKRLVNPLDENETIENLIYDSDAQIVILDVLKADFIVPGQYYYIGIPEISAMEMHPFSVARATIRDRTRVLRFVIRNTGAPRAAKSGGNVLDDGSGGGGEKPRKTWTSQLFAMAKEGRMPKSYRLDGPYGVPQVNPIIYENICMVAGGTGISPQNCMLQALALGLGPVIGNIDDKRNIALFWVVRDRSTFLLMYKDLETFGQRLRQMPDKRVTLRVFITFSATAGLPAVDAPPLPKKLRCVEVLEGRRPNFAEEFAAFQKNCQENVFARGSYSSSSTAALYMSGPDGLMNEAAKCAASLQGLAMHIHKEQQTI